MVRRVHRRAPVRHVVADPTMSAHSTYLLDLGARVRREAERARRALRDAPEAERDFAAGRVMALTSTLSLMCQLADAHDLPREDVSLDDIDPERDLLG
jgi:hypothetical protein